jgi:hypothetical protein
MTLVPHPLVFMTHLWMYGMYICMYCLLIVNHYLFICLWGAAVSHVNYSVGRGMELQMGKCLGGQYWSEDTDVIRFSLLNSAPISLNSGKQLVGCPV